MKQIDVFVPTGKSRHIGRYKAILDYANVDNKALIPLNGKPMIYYVLEELNKSKTVKSITIAGLTKEDISFEIQKPLEFIEGGISAFDTFERGMKHFISKKEPPKYILNVGSDIPLVTSEMIDKIVASINENNDIDVYLNITMYEDFKKSFPERRKTKTNLKRGPIAGGDLNVLTPYIIEGKSGKTLRRIFKYRRSTLHMVRIFSPKLIFRYLLKSLSIEDIIKLAEKKFNLKGAAIITSFCGQCADVDNVEDITIMEEWLKKPKYKLSAKDSVIITDGEKIF
ncbi:MAG: cytidylyltransferase domain-containing protein [Promethearchaeota archaeon]